MTMIDGQLSAAADELRGDLEQVELPPFSPKRSATPIMLVLVLLLGIGIVGYVARSRPGDTGGVSVATQPEVPETVLPDVPGETSADQETTDLETAIPTAVEQTPLDSAALAEDSTFGPDGQPAGQAVPLGRSVSVTNAASGEFFVPLPMAEAWNVDAIRLLVYRTGATTPGHQVVDTLDRDVEPINLPFTPADVEQVYWNPLNSEQLLYTEGALLMVFDLTTLTSTSEHQFDGCERVDSGVLPVPPATDGTLSLLCRNNGSVTQISYDLATGAEVRIATQSDTAAFPSPSGDRLVRGNPDGSASILGRDLTETGVELDLGSNRFGFVTDPEGREWIASSLFDGSTIGSVVILPLDGLDDPIDVVGPDRGDAYPPSGTFISASGTKVAISIQGADDGALAGRVTVLDLAESFTEPTRESIPHRSTGEHGYWSTPFVAVNPLGLFAYSTDVGGNAVNTIVTYLVPNGS